MDSHPGLSCNTLFIFAPGLCSATSRYLFLSEVSPAEKWIVRILGNGISKGLSGVFQASSGEDNRNQSQYTFSNRTF